MLNKGNTGYAARGDIPTDSESNVILHQILKNNVLIYLRFTELGLREFILTT